MPSSEKFCDNVVAQFNGKLLDCAFRVTILDAMFPENCPRRKRRRKSRGVCST